MLFECSCCGECCRGDMKVYLNPEDLILMARFLGFDNTRNLFDQGYVVIGMDKNRAPLPRIRFGRGAAGGCPFLENRLSEEGNGYRLSGLCRLHPDSKPLVCLLAPLHRTVDLDTDTEQWGMTAPLPGCPGFTESDGGAYSEQPGAPDGLENRLTREAAFYRRLSAMLDEKAEAEQIVETLYHLKTDCKTENELV